MRKNFISILLLLFVIPIVFSTTPLEVKISKQSVDIVDGHLIWKVDGREYCPPGMDVYIGSDTDEAVFSCEDETIPAEGFVKAILIDRHTQSQQIYAYSYKQRCKNIGGECRLLCEGSEKPFGSEGCGFGQKCCLPEYRCRDDVLLKAIEWKNSYKYEIDRYCFSGTVCDAKAGLCVPSAGDFSGRCEDIPGAVCHTPIELSGPPYPSSIKAYRDVYGIIEGAYLYTCEVKVSLRESGMEGMYSFRRYPCGDSRQICCIPQIIEAEEPERKLVLSCPPIVETYSGEIVPIECTVTSGLRALANADVSFDTENMIIYFTTDDDGKVLYEYKAPEISETAVFSILALAEKDGYEKDSAEISVVVNAIPAEDELAEGNIRVTNYEDVNGNGIGDEGEELLSGEGFSVEIVSGTGENIQETFSVSGELILSGLAPGDYELTYHNSYSYWQTTSDKTQTVSVISGETAEIGFGNRRVRLDVICSPDVFELKAREERDIVCAITEMGRISSGSTVLLEKDENVIHDSLSDSEGKIYYTYSAPETSVRFSEQITVTATKAGFEDDSDRIIATVSPPGVGSIVVINFNDEDGDGKQDEDEERLQGERFVVNVGSESFEGQKDFKDTGVVTFGNLKGGEYSVEFINGYENWETTTSPSLSARINEGKTITISFGSRQIGEVTCDVIEIAPDEINDYTCHIKYENGDPIINRYVSFQLSQQDPSEAEPISGQEIEKIQIEMKTDSEGAIVMKVSYNSEERLIYILDESQNLIATFAPAVPAGNTITGMATGNSEIAKVVTSASYRGNTGRGSITVVHIHLEGDESGRTNDDKWHIIECKENCDIRRIECASRGDCIEEYGICPILLGEDFQDLQNTPCDEMAIEEICMRESDSNGCDIVLEHWSGRTAQAGVPKGILCRCPNIVEEISSLECVDIEDGIKLVDSLTGDETVMNDWCYTEKGRYLYELQCLDEPVRALPDSTLYYEGNERNCFSEGKVCWSGDCLKNCESIDNNREDCEAYGHCQYKVNTLLWLDILWPNECIFA